MMTNERVFDKKSVWLFTKQNVAFDNAFCIAKMFSDLTEGQKEDYHRSFNEKYAQYGISEDNYRTTVIPQFYGLITKTPFNSKRGYAGENSTAIVDLLRTITVGTREYNTLKTEQLLKLRFRALIDNGNNNLNYAVLPIIFSFCVLKRLKDFHAIKNVSIDLFYTNIMTGRNFEDVEDAVEGVVSKRVASREVIDSWKSNCRVQTLFETNIKLFLFQGDAICINPDFEEYFQKQFIEKFDLDELFIQLTREADYANFLYNHQGFGINLIDLPIGIIESPVESIEQKKRAKRVVEISKTEVEDDDSDYVQKVDSVKISNINEDIAIGAHAIKPEVATTGTVKRYSKNPMLGKVAIKKCGYKCVAAIEHTTFESPKTGQPFMEAHHLIPITNLEIIWDKYGVNIDCTENLVSLCPTCHRAIHYGSKEIKKELIIKVFNFKKTEYKKIGFNITLDEVLKMY